MVCTGLENLTSTGIADILAFPTSCDYYFYAKIMGAIFVILSFLLFQREKRRVAKPDMLSCMGVSALATIFISLIGTFLTIIKPDIFIEITVIGMIFVAIWLIKR